MENGRKEYQCINIKHNGLKFFFYAQETGKSKTVTFNAPTWDTP